ncbi:MAG: imidazolonepropionase [Armatimonadetes bacterium]|nr:imidazolonepropionase [Armatimonadota bacterium]
MSRVAVRNIGQLVTMRGSQRGRAGGEMSDIGLVSDGEVHIVAGQVVFAGLSSDAPSFTADDEYDAAGGVVTPGLVDAHTHAVFAGDRADEFEERATGMSYQEIAARGGGILSTVRKTREASESDLYQQSLKHAQWMVRCGTTTAEIKSGYGLDLETELKMLRVAKDLATSGLTVVRTFLGAHAVPPEARSNVEYLDFVIHDMLPKIREHCEYVDMFVEDKYFDKKDATRYAEAAKALGLGVRLHVDQMRDSGGALLATQLQADTADHLEYSGKEGLACMDQSRTMPVLLPGSVYGIRADKYPDFAFMKEIGLPVVLASDFNPGSSPTPSLPFCMSLAVTKMGLSVAEALTACTINAAYSLKRGHRVGSLEPDKQGDLVIWGLKDYREIAYWIGFSPIRHVLAQGSCLFSG